MARSISIATCAAHESVPISHSHESDPSTGSVGWFLWHRGGSGPVCFPPMRDSRSMVEVCDHCPFRRSKMSTELQAGVLVRGATTAKSAWSANWSPALAESIRGRQRASKEEGRPHRHLHTQGHTRESIARATATQRRPQPRKCEPTVCRFRNPSHTSRRRRCHGCEPGNIGR